MKLKSAKKKSMLKNFLICCAGVALGIYFLKEHPIAAYSSIIFFGLGIVVFIIQLLPNSSYLELKTEGFVYRVLFRDKFIPWHAVDYFYAAQMQDGKSSKAAWYYTYEAAGESSANRTYPHGMLPENYGKSAEELAEVLNSYRNRED